MKYKTAELGGDALDYLVHCAHRDEPPCMSPAEWVASNDDGFNPSKNWAQGGPIIERNRIGVVDRVSCWVAGMIVTSAQCPSGKAPFADGPTALVAAMRCYVQFKFGDEVELP
jgi:hypothetical protein